MPLYDYRCTACGREVEVMHAIHDSGPETCEACGGAMRKALSPPAIHFKGSGWAKKDAAAATARKAKSKPGSTSDKAKSDDGAESTRNAGAKTEETLSAKAETKSTASPTAGSTTD